MQVRNKQCAACPWKVSTVPARDIPNGYCRDKHANLHRTIAGSVQVPDPDAPMRLMACHESTPGRDYPCVGWLVNQLGPGNNLPLRMLSRDGRFARLEVDGRQHKRFEDTVPMTTTKQLRSIGETIAANAAGKASPKHQAPGAAEKIIEIAKTAIAKGASLREVARHMDIDGGYLSALLNGRRLSVGAAVARRVGQAVGIDLLEDD